MKTVIAACLVAVPMMAIEVHAQTTTVWNPGANPATKGLWSEGPNWSLGAVPANTNKAVLNVGTAISCTVNSAATPAQLVIGDNGPGAMYIVNGGSLTNGNYWTGVGYNNLARLEIQSGGTALFNDHLWVGLNPGSDGTLVMNGGTAFVIGMFGLGWSGGKGAAQLNGGTLTLAQWQATNSIKGASILDIRAGRIVITNDVTTSVDDYVANGKITGYGGIGTVARVYDTNANTTTITATKTPGAGGPYPATDWPTNINPNKMVHYYVSDGMLNPPNANWNNSLSLCNDGDQAVADVTLKGLLGKRATANNLNIIDQAFQDWNTNAEIDILLQVYGDASVLRPSDASQGRRIQFLTGTLPTTALVSGGNYATNAYNSKWNWILFTITNTPIADGTGTNRQVGAIKTNAPAGSTYGGVNNGTIRLQGPDNNVNGLTIHAAAFGEKGAFGTANDINQFEVPDDSCPPPPNENLAGVDYNAGYTNHLQVINDPASGQTVTFANNIGPAGDQRKAVIPDGQYLNFGILSNYLGQACNENVTVKVCVDYYDDPAFAGNYVMFGPDSYAIDSMGDLASFPISGLALLEGTGQWIRQSWTISGVNLLGVNTAPLTGGPRFASFNGQVAVSRFYLAVLRTLGPLAGQDPLADCYADPKICLGVYGNYAELDLANGITNGLDLGSSKDDQTFVVEQAGPANDQRLSVRGDSPSNYYLNFQILTNALGPTSQGNVRLAMAVTYYDDPALAGRGFRPQVWKYQKFGSTPLNFMGPQQNLVLQGTGKWREAYWEIGTISFDGVNQGPQAAARFECEAPIDITRVRYAVIRPCGATAGQNLLSNKVRLAAAPDTNALLRLSWPCGAPQAVLQSTPTLGGAWSPFAGTPAIEGGEQAVVRFGPTNSNSQFFRLTITPP